jgi:hypothetical protein
MTTTAKQKAKPAKHDLTHGPVAAAFNASAWPMFFAAIGKATGVIPPWVALAAAVVLAGCLAAAGMHRRPRPLSRVSVIYRAGVVMFAGGWLWSQLATFRHVDLDGSQIAALLIAWPLTLALGVVAFGARRLPMLFRLLLPVVPGVVAVVVTVAQRAATTEWLTGALVVPDRFVDVAGALTWLLYTVLTLAVVAGPVAVLGVTFASRERSADDELAAMQRRDGLRTPGGQAREFLKLICNLTSEYTEWRPEDPYQAGRKIPNLSITDVKFWDNAAGEDYIIDLTGMKKGTTRTRLRSYTDEMATKLNLPHGCGIEILPARDEAGEPLGAGFASVAVSRVNRLKVEIPYPELQPRSIMNPLPLGHTRAGKEIGPRLRESSAFLWGQKGSGKTVCISCIIAGAMQCTDCLVWVIDLNRGNAARPFLRAWQEGRVDRPCIDWVATTIEEVVEMASVGLQIALDRKSFYADLKFELDTNLMPVGNGGPGQAPPEILIVIDEGATVLGIGGGNNLTDEGRAARESLNQIMDLARDAAVNIVFSGLRATSDVADTSFKAGTAVRIGMRVSDDAELAHGFGDWNLSGKQIPYRGSGYIRCGHGDDDNDDGDDIQVFKGYFLAPKRMDSIGEQVTAWRPYLDERSLRTAGRRYATRWQRTAPLLWDNPRPEVLTYNARPGQTAPIAGDSGGRPAQSGTATAVVDPMTDLIAGGLSRPTGGSFDDLMKQAREHDEARKRRGQDGGGGEPPAPYEPPPGDPLPDEPPSADKLGAAAIRERFNDLTENMTVLENDPDRAWNRSGMITPDQELAAAPADSRAILERLVKVAGPLGTGEMHRMLYSGGDWGPAVKISKQAMHRLLKEPGSKEPVSWLAPRAAGEPYNHRDKNPG